MANRNWTMLSIFPLLILSFITFCLPMASLSAEETGDHAASIVVNGLTRTYLVHIPPSYDRTKPVPLVLVLHGGGGMGKGMLKLTGNGFIMKCLYDYETVNIL